jgi:hypothetical protein
MTRGASAILAAIGLVACSSSSGGSDSGAAGMQVLPTTGFVAEGQPGGPFVDQGTYFVRNSGSTELFWTAAPSAAWLALSSSAGALDPGESEELIVSVDAAQAQGLGAGLYTASIEFGDLQKGTTAATVSASLVVESAGSGALEVTPSELVTGGPKGGPFTPASPVLQLRNPGTGALSWRATSNVAWLALSQTQGSLAAGAEVQVTASLLAGANSLATGLHAGKVSFREASSDATLVEVEVTLGVGTSIEGESWLNVHGRPFFPIGVWNQPPFQGHVAYLKGLGINTYLNNGMTPPEPTNPQLLDLLAANDMWAILQFDSAVKAHPRLLGWLMGDEPDLYNTPPATVQQDFDTIRAADPDHFIALNTTGGFYWDANFGNPSVESQYQAYTAIPDIASFDMYPVTGWNQPSWVYMPGAMTGFLRERYVDGRKPVWAIVEASDQGLSWVPPGTPGPSAAQMRFEVWDAVIHGATAIHYFTIAFDPFTWSKLTPEIEQEMTRTNGQITELASVILRAPPAVNVTSSELGGQAHNMMLRKRGASYFLFADNADMADRSASITFTFPQTIRSVSVYGEGRAITPNGNRFTDSFAPLAVHIYEVRL